jgi:hypothetical protein
MNKTYEVCSIDELPDLTDMPGMKRIIDHGREEECEYGTMVIGILLLNRGYNVSKVRDAPFFTVKHMKPADETIIYLIAADVGYSLKEVEHEESI